MVRRKKKATNRRAAPGPATPDDDAINAVIDLADVEDDAPAIVLHPPPPMMRDPARELARLMLEDALGQAGGLAAHREEPVLIIRAPDAAWLPLTAVAWNDINKEFGKSVDDSDSNAPGKSRPEPHVISNGGPQRRAGDDESVLTRALLNRQQIIGISHDPENCLPADIMRADPVCIVVRPPLPTMLGQIASRLTGGDWTRSPSSAAAARMDPMTLRLAIREGQTADDYLHRLERLAPVKPARDQAAITFNDLPGLGAAVEWGRSLARDLTDFKAGKIPWSAVDKGALLAGGPGTGKTSFARAVGNECGVEMISTSYATWQSSGDGHLGPVTKAIRKVFDDAREAAPCILFIDEIDSVNSRGAPGQNQDWWRAIVNTLLEQLDGLTGREGVVVLAATNNPDAIDPAIRRAGRLDRVIEVGMPGRADLEAIMRVHLGDDLADADLVPAAADAHALGATGADIEKCVRGARRRARHASRPIALADLQAEIPVNPDKRSPGDRHAVAVHEAGHALAREMLCPGTVEEISIRPSGIVGGFVKYKNEVVLLTPEEVQVRLMCRLAGRAAEEIVFGAPSGSAGDGEASDLALSTLDAFEAEMCLGLDGDLVWRGVKDPQQVVQMLILRHDLAARVSARLTDAYDRALSTLLPHEGVLREIAAILERQSALTGDELRAIMTGAPAMPGRVAAP